MSKQMVQCATHGNGELVFICDHLLASLRDREPRGLFQWFNENGNVCAWCSDCAEKAEKSSKGPDRMPLKFEVATLCAKCFEPIRQMNGGGVLYR